MKFPTTPLVAAIATALLLGPFALAAAAPARTAACPRQAPTAAGVIATENAWVAALEQRNSAALDCILDPAFADTSWRGELVPKAVVLERLPSRPASTLRLSEVRTTMLGDIAMVRGVNTQTSGAKVTGSVRFVDIFGYRSHRWQALSAQESLIQPN